MNNQHHAIQPYCNVNQKIFDNCVNKLFFDQIEKPDKSQQMATIEIFKKHQNTKLTRGYGKIGFENLVRFFKDSCRLGKRAFLLLTFVASFDGFLHEMCFFWWILGRMDILATYLI
jgi:hypothetical protein